MGVSTVRRVCGPTTGCRVSKRLLATRRAGAAPPTAKRSGAERNDDSAAKPESVGEGGCHESPEPRPRRRAGHRLVPAAFSQRANARGRRYRWPAATLDPCLRPIVFRLPVWPAPRCRADVVWMGLEAFLLEQ